MSEAAEHTRASVLAAIIEHGIGYDADADSDAPEEGIVTAFGLVVEWMSPDGRRWLTTVHGGGTPEDDSVPGVWALDGMHRHAIRMLNGDD